MRRAGASWSLAGVSGAIATSASPSVTTVAVEALIGATVLEPSGRLLLCAIREAREGVGDA